MRLCMTSEVFFALELLVTLRELTSPRRCSVGLRNLDICACRSSSIFHCGTSRTFLSQYQVVRGKPMRDTKGEGLR